MLYFYIGMMADRIFPFWVKKKELGLENKEVFYVKTDGKYRRIFDDRR